MKPRVYYRLGAMGILQPKRLVITFFQQMFSRSSAVGTALLANRLHFTQILHRATETALAKSGVPFALLRNGWYMKNYLRSAAIAVQHGAVVGCAGVLYSSKFSRDPQYGMLNSTFPVGQIILPAQ